MGVPGLAKLEVQLLLKHLLAHLVRLQSLLGPAEGALRLLEELGQRGPAGGWRRGSPPALGQIPCPSPFLSISPLPWQANESPICRTCHFTSLCKGRFPSTGRRWAGAEERRDFGPSWTSWPAPRGSLAKMPPRAVAAVASFYLPLLGRQHHQGAGGASLAPTGRKWRLLIPGEQADQAAPERGPGGPHRTSVCSCSLPLRIRSSGGRI